MGLAGSGGRVTHPQNLPGTYLKEEGISMKKRILAVLLALCLALTLAPSVASAAQSGESPIPFAYSNADLQTQPLSMSGTEYSDAIVFTMGYTGISNGNTAEVTYNFKGAYESLSFDAGFVGGSQRNAQMTVVADGTVVLGPEEISYVDVAKTYTVSLTGVSQLTIRFTSNGYDKTRCAVGGVTVELSGAAPSEAPLVSDKSYNAPQYLLQNTTVLTETFSMGGYRYENGYRMRMGYTGTSSGNTSKISFNFKNEYRTLSFDIARYMTGSVSYTRSAYLTVEVDGEALPNYKGRELKWNDLSLPVEVDLNGVSQVTVTLVSDGYDGVYWAMGNIQMEKIVTGTPVTGVTLSQSSLSLTKGNSASLTAAVSPDDADDKSVTWTSSSPQTAKVDANGRVTAVAAGTAVITVTTSDGGYTATCRVGVSEEDKKVTGVTISKTSLTMEAGQTQTLTAAVAPTDAKDRSVTWASSNAAVASVDSNGRVTALSAGAAEITVKTADGGFTAECRVIVKGTATPDGVEVHFPRINVYHQDQFTDVKANQWYTDSIADAFELGLMKGTSATTFNPHGDVTVAEAIAMACRVHAIYTTGSDSAIVPQAGALWYQPYLDYAYLNGLINNAYYNSDVMQKATRAQFAEIFANSLPDNALPPINNIADGKIPDVPMTAYYAGAAYKLYRAGILAGGDALGTFSPNSFITRKEAAGVIARMAESNNRRSFTL